MESETTQNRSSPDETSKQAEQLLSAALAGDAAALGTLLGDIRPQLLSVAASLLGEQLAEKADASDIVQDGLAAACKGFDDFRGKTVAELRGWLTEIVRNETWTALRYWHEQRRDVNREGSEPTDTGALAEFAADTSTPSHHGRRNEDAEWLKTMIERLPDDEQTVVRLRHLEGWGLKEISDLLGRTPAGTAGLLKRALHRMRAQPGSRQQGSNDG